jgi:translocation and assembly module TamB
MSRPARTIRNIVIGFGILLVLLSLVGLFAIRTDWFRETVRQKIIASTEEATGGKVDLGSFDFEISHLRAIVRNLVIHGREDIGSAPFVRIEQVEVHLRPFTSIRHIIDITYL